MILDIDIETVSNDRAQALSSYIAAPSETAVLMRLDVSRAMRDLSPRQKMICRLLAVGHTRTEIAEILGISRTMVSEEIASVRRVFKRYHLDVYVSNSKGRRGQNA